MDKATLEDPVREMFYSHETTIPDKVFDGLLPSDVYSRLSFYSDRQSFEGGSSNLTQENHWGDSEERRQVKDGTFLPFPPSPVMHSNIASSLKNLVLNETQATICILPEGKKRGSVRFQESKEQIMDENGSSILDVGSGHGDIAQPLPTETSVIPPATPYSSSSLFSSSSSPIRNFTTSNSVDLDMCLVEGADAEGQIKSAGFNANGNAMKEMKQNVVSADDFLPMFTYMLVQADLPQLLLVKEMMTNLIDDEETYGECGYYLATLEAATQHLCDLAETFKRERGEEVTNTHTS